MHYKPLELMFNVFVLRASLTKNRCELISWSPFHLLTRIGMIIAVCGEQVLCRGNSRNEHSQICKKNIARRAAIEFGRSDIGKGLEDAHKSHELHTGSASVVVTTTSSHVNAEGSTDDPLDEDLLSKPRGFFADQFEVLTLINKC